MKFIWPELLWFLLLVPLLVAAYVYVLRRKRREALRYPSLAMVRAGSPQRAWRRHVPPALFLLGLLGALLAAARPSALITLLSHQKVIILAIDVSLSMRATDVVPNRIAAAQAAAKSFIADVPGDVRIGIVSFAGTAALVQSPTSNKEDLIAAVDRLQLDRQTAIGSGIVMSLITLFPDHGIDLESMVLPYYRYGGRSAFNPPPKPPAKKPDKPFVAVEPGSNQNAAIILLTDGRRTTGPHPIDAARLAAERGIKVYTVGFGTPQGAQVSIEGYSIYMAFDEETLRAIAEFTRAEYFHASTGEQLRKIYESLSSKIILQREHTEITFLFAAVSSLLLLLSGGLSLLWFNRTF